MSYNDRFKYDVFLSYARVDNQSSTSDRGWVDLFNKELGIVTGRYLGSSDSVNIWRDTRKIDGSQLFDLSIKEALDDSFLLLCLLSPGYLKSKYCKEELKYFYKQASKDALGLSLGDRNRILFLRLDKISKPLPDELAGITGFHAHDKDEPGDHVDPFEINDKESRYNQMIKEVSNAIVKTLENVRQRETSLESSGYTTSPGLGSMNGSGADPFSIFFADVPSDFERLKFKTVKHLRKQGHEVFDSIPPPKEHQEHQRAVTERLKKVDLSIHLLNENPGNLIVDLEEDLTYPQKQVEIGFDHAKNQMIWTPYDLDREMIQVEGYKSFLQELETRKERDYQLVKRRESTLANDIDDLINMLKEKELEKKSSDQPQVLLDTHFKDHLFAADINTRLIQNDIHPYLNPHEDEPEININLLTEMIKKVSKIVFIYGQISKKRVLARMIAAAKLIVNNDFPVEDFIVFMVPPAKDPDEIQMRQKIMSIRIIDNSTSQVIEPESINKMLSNFPEK